MTKQEKIRKRMVGICEEFGLNWNEATYLIDYLFVNLDDNKEGSEHILSKDCWCNPEVISVPKREG